MLSVNSKAVIKQGVNDKVHILLLSNQRGIGSFICLTVTQTSAFFMHSANEQPDISLG
jgi:hypothetical protein